jgi:glycosyltransferase involved in cell wall biosynthesis
MELYIERCINSIVNQSYKNLEIIIINDGSTDNSLKLINELYKDDTRIHLINKKNEGIGGAYADGLSYANGDYISFVDGDDYCELDMYEILSNLIMKESYDLIQFCDRHFNSNNETIGKWFHLKQTLILDNAQIIRHQFEAIKVPSLACKIFKKNLFEGIESIKQNIGIDYLITFQVLLKSNSLLVIPDALYNVYIRTDSISRSAYNESSINQSIVLFKGLIEMFKSKKNTYLSNYIVVHYLNLVIVLGRSIYERTNKSELLNFIKEKAEFKKYYKMIPNSSEVINFKTRIKLKAFKLNPYTYYRFYNFLINKKG